MFLCYVSAAFTYYVVHIDIFLIYIISYLSSTCILKYVHSSFVVCKLGDSFDFY